MPTITAQKIVNDALSILLDAAGDRWSPADCLSWLNEGQRAVSALKFNAYVKSAPVKLIAGTRQQAPADCVQIIDVPRNLGADGQTPGRAVRITERATLDAAVPAWHSAPPSAVVKHYIYNALVPMQFYCYPPQPSSGQGFVEIQYGAIPPEVVAIGNVITLDDIYEAALLEYVLYRAFSRDSEFAADAGQAATHYSAFVALITGKAKAEIGGSPNNSAPSRPNKAPTPA